MSIKEFIYFSVLPNLNRFVLNPLRLKLVTARTPNRNFAEFFRHIAALGVRPATVIDIGVGKGTFSLYDSNRHADFYLIEAVPDSKGTVRKIADRLGAKFFNVAAGSARGEIEFFVHSDTTGSSMYRQLEGVAALDGTRVSVPVLPLDEMIPASVPRPCVLKVDTQGAEIEVIRGASNTLAQVDIAILEVSLHQFREHGPEIGTVIEEMAKRGFVIYETLEGHYRPIDEALAQLDLVFVPEGSMLRKQKSFFNAEQAEAYVRSTVLH